MNLDKLVAVSGLSGIHRIVGNRSNGVLIEDLKTGKRKFASMRRYQFTPLESIAIYTTEDAMQLGKVFDRMHEQKDDNPPANPNGSADEIKEYFADVLPDYDPDRVHLSDMKKVIKWYNFLAENDALVADESIAEAETATAADDVGDEEE